jgi:hypothetical protein
MSLVEINHLPFRKVLDELNKLSTNFFPTPIFSYIGIGTFNHINAYPEPDLQHEFPKYIQDFDYEHKVLILIDPLTTNPLIGYPIELIHITNEPLYDKYISAKISDIGLPILTIFVIKQYIYVDYNVPFCNCSKLNITFCRNFIFNLVRLTMKTHPMSLTMISNYTGSNWYHLQDEFINMFDPSFHDDVRNRFLIDSRYLNNIGCYYELTNRMYQPIIENGLFYNPGFLSATEYNIKLRELLLANHDDKFISNMKKKFMLELFYKYIEKYLNDDYRTQRINCNESTKEMILTTPFYRDQMLEFVTQLLYYIESFININEFIENLKVSNIYSDEATIRSTIINIIGINDII